MAFNSTTTQRLFERKLQDLENAQKREAGMVKGTYPSPLPFMMYAFATIDYFSSCWAGWNDTPQRPSNDSRSQTERMIEFLEKCLKYGRRESLVAIQLWRHKLMHTSEPRQLKDRANSDTYTWFLTNGILGVERSRHWKLARDQSEVILTLAIPYLTEDLRNGIFGEGEYFDELCTSPTLQTNLESFQNELDNYTLQ